MYYLLKFQPDFRKEMLDSLVISGGVSTFPNQPRAAGSQDVKAPGHVLGGARIPIVTCLGPLSPFHLSSGAAATTLVRIPQFLVSAARTADAALK